MYTKLGTLPLLLAKKRREVAAGRRRHKPYSRKGEEETKIGKGVKEKAKSSS